MTEPIHIISLGAGVQSSTMSLMAACGEITPMPKCAIFADTQAEPKSVYTWLDWLEKQLPFPVYRVTAGSLETTVTQVKPRKDGNGGWTKSNLPCYTLTPDGQEGHMPRGCTYDFKMLPLLKKQREIGGIKRNQKTIGVVSWIGISLDEAHRMKDSRFPWCLNRYPLVDASVNRRKCLEWMRDKGFPEPPRSACVFCPYHSDREWRRLKNDDAQAFTRAVEFELRLQSAYAEVKVRKSVPYLHAKRVPLSEIDFSTEEERGQLNMFNNECEGMCGV